MRKNFISVFYFIMCLLITQQVQAETIQATGQIVPVGPNQPYNANIKLPMSFCEKGNTSTRSNFCRDIKSSAGGIYFSAVGQGDEIFIQVAYKNIPQQDQLTRPNGDVAMVTFGSSNTNSVQFTLNTPTTTSTTTSTDASGNVTTTGQGSNSMMHATVSVTETAAQHAVTLQRQTALTNALISCTPSTISMPHPLVPNFTVNLQVHGMVNGKCEFTQNMPNNGMQTCFFSDQQRNQLRQNPNISTIQNFMQDPNTCKITGY